MYTWCVVSSSTEAVDLTAQLRTTSGEERNGLHEEVIRLKAELKGLDHVNGL